MKVLLCTAAGFVLGSIPFSVVLGRLALSTDIRTRGDANPGAANAWEAGGWRLGVPSLLLDYFKGAVPVFVAHFVLGIGRWALVPLVVAPVAGHAFSPFLGFKGGKALAVTFGVWTGLTLGEAPLILGLFFTFWMLIQQVNAWSVMFGMVGMLAHLVLRGSTWPLLVIWSLNMIVLVWKHRSELSQPPTARSWLWRSRRRIP